MEPPRRSAPSPSASRCRRVSEGHRGAGQGWGLRARPALLQAPPCLASCRRLPRRLVALRCQHALACSLLCSRPRTASPRQGGHQRPPTSCSGPQPATGSSAPLHSAPPAHPSWQPPPSPGEHRAAGLSVPPARPRPRPRCLRPAGNAPARRAQRCRLPLLPPTALPARSFSGQAAPAPSCLPVHREEQEALACIQAFLTGPTREEAHKMKFLASLCTLSRLAGAQSRGQGSPADRAAQARSGPGATATAMLSKASTLRKVLWELLSMLEERPLRKPFLTTRDSTRVLALAATRALCELLQQCSRSQEVKAFFSRLCLALLFQIAFTAELTPQDLAVFRRQCHRWDPCTPTSPVSSAVQTLESLFCCAGYEHQALLIRQQGGWHMLLSAETLHLGVIVVARELRKSPAPEQRWMLNQLVALLEREDEFREIPAMAFFSEVGLMTGGASCHLPALVPVLCSQLLVQGRRRRGCRGSRGQRSRWAGVPWGTGKGLRGPAGSLWSQLPAGGVLCGLAGLAQSCQWAPARRQGAGSAAGLVRLSVPCVFQLLMCADLRKVEERVLNLLQRYVRHHSAVMRWLVLRGLLPVSERATMVSRGEPGKAVQERGGGQRARGKAVSWALRGPGRCGGCAAPGERHPCPPERAPRAGPACPSSFGQSFSQPSLSWLHQKHAGCVTQARKMHLLLPDLMKCLQDADRDIRLKALMVLRNVFSYTDRQRAQPTTLQLMEMLLPLFDDEASQLRQLSILLFKDVMETVGWSDKWRMKQEVQRSLLPLFFHMSDERRRVAQASRETLLQAAQLLQWEQLRHLAKTGQTGKISECMLARYRSRAEDYVGQSLPFLQDPQASLREAAVRFIALQPLQNDSHPCVSALATQTILMLRPPQENSPSAFSLRALRSRLRRSWGRWHVLLGCCSVGAELEQQC
ncbi:uncharacterized protein [Struthio camelus]|uniref:uncharacterized protein isoform X2 n=1 Tax=Struthio camelus TaxID=8801 RepID=UPI0036042972